MIVHLVFSIPYNSLYLVLFPGLVLKSSCAMTTDLNDLRENDNYVEIKSLINKVRCEKKIGMDTMSFGEKNYKAVTAKSTL